MTTFETLRSIISTTLKVPPEKITEATVSDDLAAWDSIGQVNLMMAVEQTFDIMLEAEDFAALMSVRAILDHLQKLGRG